MSTPRAIRQQRRAAMKRDHNPEWLQDGQRDADTVQERTESKRVDGDRGGRKGGAR